MTRLADCTGDPSSGTKVCVHMNLARAKFIRTKLPLEFAGNLEENDRIKAELDPAKINEPKTPYRGPLAEPMDDDDEEEHGLGHYLPSGLPRLFVPFCIVIYKIVPHKQLTNRLLLSSRPDWLIA